MGLTVSVEDTAPDLIRIRCMFVNAYILGNQNGWVLIDAGLKDYASVIKKVAESRFGTGTKPSAILLTHGHFDHVGALPELLQEWDVPVYCHPLEKPFLTGEMNYPEADPSVGGGLMARMSFIFSNEGIDLGDRVDVLPQSGAVPFALDWKWIHTPGHTPGHVSFFRESDRCLIAGDAFVTTKQESLKSVLLQKRGVFGPPAYFTPDWCAAWGSVRRLAQMKPLIAATGHGEVLRDEELRTGLDRLVAQCGSNPATVSLKQETEDQEDFQQIEPQNPYAPWMNPACQLEETARRHHSA